MPLPGGLSESSQGLKNTVGMMQPQGTDFSPIQENVPPVPDVKIRMVVNDSYLSLLVNNVEETQNKIIDSTKRFGGYMVENNLTNPQDAATGTTVVRVPSTDLQQALEQFRSFSVKVITENLTGQDVTDQFVDNQAQLDTLTKTKAKFEDILEKASKVSDILEVQREIINVQSQIDSVKGQQQYLQKTAQMAKITIYLSTDELALPYSPTQSWRPGVIFKEAVRSIIGHIRQLGTVLIWVAVYSVVWIPLLAIVLILKKRGYLNFLK